jgi:hypothetical protein
MMLRTVNNEYIEVDDVEVERQAKLFQNIGDTAGDFSYSFSIDANSENLAKLDILSPVDGFQKSIYTINDVSLCDNDGSVIYSGYIRISSITDVVDASFFSGNNNWFSLMTGDLKDLDLTEYEVDIELSSMLDTAEATNGVIFPLINTGAFSTRSIPTFYIDDMQPCIYVKDVILKCFQYSGLKLAGSILSDWRYNRLITTSNRESPSSRIEERTVIVSKLVDQSVTGVSTVIDFEVEDSIGDLGLWSSVANTYTADVPMYLTVVVEIAFTLVGGPITIFVNLLKNGVDLITGTSTITPNQEATCNWPVPPNQLKLEAGDTLEVRIRQSGGTVTLTSANMKITPTQILRSYPEGILPEVTQINFCLEVFKIFNTVMDYDPFTKTVTVDFFKDIIRKDEIDISEFIDTSTIKVDYVEALEGYGNINNLQYAEADSTLTDNYKSGKIYPYGSGQIVSDNDFVDNSVNILESIFASTAEDNNNPYGLSMPHVDFTELEFGAEYTATVTNNSGVARFTTTVDSFPILGELIFVYDSTVDSYLGQYPVSLVAADDQFELTDLPYESNATVRIKRARVVTKNNSDQLLLLVLNGSDANIVGGLLAYAYFYKPRITNSHVTDIDAFSKSLSFGTNDIPLAYQRTMIEDYWADLGPILQDPVKVYVDAYLPKAVFESITFKQPLRLKTDKFNARFFPNRITGYKSSDQPCTLELIKLP